MNREIKFRAWDKIGKFMYDRVLAGPGDPCSIVWVDATKEWVHFDDGCGTIMQYTGLKDRNGKEIYEGDILECSLPVEIIDNGLNSLDSETINAKVVYENGCFLAEGKTVNYPWVLDGDKTILSWLCEIKAYDRYDTSIKVIGNIYENFEQLEG